MNSRLQQFLTLENLTPARFADIMNIQRSNVSHLLSGRNKPSWDFIQRFAAKFPNVSTDWLLFGKGKPYKEGDSTQNDRNSTFGSTSTPIINDIFTQIDTETGDFQFPSEDSDITDISDVTPQPPISRPKDIRRITLYYSDGTFQEFFPGK